MWSKIKDWIQGPKWCGKSTTAKIFSNSILQLQNNQTLKLIKLQISTNSNYFLEKATPILIDEWQEIPEIWDLIRLEVDKRKKWAIYFNMFKNTWYY